MLQNQEQKPYTLSHLATQDGGMYADHDATMLPSKDGTTIIAIKY